MGTMRAICTTQNIHGEDRGIVSSVLLVIMVTTCNSKSKRKVSWQN